MLGKILAACWIVVMTVVGLSAAAPGISLLDAVKTADTATVRALLKERVDVNAPAADGTTALHWAAHRGDLENTDLLIQAGANVNAVNRYGVTPLSLSAENGNAAVIERLLKAGANPNSSLPGGETALMTAARTGRADAVKELLAHGANPNAKESTRGQTALMWAAVEGHAAAIKVLIEGGADIHARSHGPVSEQITSSYKSYAQGLLKRKNRVDAFTPLLFAARAGRIDAARTLLESGANVNDTVEDGTSVLVIAIINAHYELAALLLDKGADPNAAAQGWTALHQVVRSRSLNMHNVPVPVPTGNMSSMELTKKIVAHGADINARMTKPMLDGYENKFNRIGATPLMLAAKGVDHEMMRFLVANGADPQIRTEIGTTILMAAAGNEMAALGSDSGLAEDAREAVKIAVELDIDPNAVNDKGDTALHGAAWRGDNPIVQFLVDHGARLDAKNKNGCAPINVANGDTACSQSLAYRPATRELFIQLMTARALPIQIESAQETYSFQIRKDSALSPVAPVIRAKDQQQPNAELPKK